MSARFDGARSVRAACLGLLLCGALGLAHAQNTIKAVSGYVQHGATIVQIDLAQPLDELPGGFAIQNPARIALDFPGVASEVGRAAVEVNQANLRSINVVQAGERSRVVLNLWQPASYKTEIQGSTLRVTLQSAGAAASPTQARPLASATSAPAGSEPVTLNFFNADIEAVARTMAVVTGRDVVVDPRVKGTMNLVTERAIPPAAAFDQFAHVLLR